MIGVILKSDLDWLLWCWILEIGTESIFMKIFVER